jgi:DNA-binding MarR family transcriptional regulator
MHPIEKPSAVTLAAQALRGMLREGSCGPRLPGTRVLAGRLGLSAPTVAAALDLLAAEGLLRPGGERRAYRLTDAGLALRKHPHIPTGPARDLLILTHDEPSQLVDSTRRLLEALQREMVARDWKVRSQVVDFFHVKNPQSAWDHRIEHDAGTRILAVYGRTPLAEWAVRRQARMLFLGGDAGPWQIPKIAVSSARMAETALSRLVALGHRRILFPLCDRSDSFKESIRSVTRNALESTGTPYLPAVHNPESDYLAPDVTRRILEKAFSTLQPTALVFLDWKEVVAASCFLARCGLLIPRDVSLVTLSDSVTAEWFHPKLCRFRFPQKRLLAALHRWLEDKPGSDRGVSLPGIFLPGESIGPPPAA